MVKFLFVSSLKLNFKKLLNVDFNLPFTYTWFYTTIVKQLDINSKCEVCWNVKLLKSSEIHH